MFKIRILIYINPYIRDKRNILNKGGNNLFITI